MTLPDTGRCHARIGGYPPERCSNVGDLYHSGVLYSYACPDHARALQGVKQWWRASDGVSLNQIVLDTAAESGAS